MGVERTEGGPAVPAREAGFTLIEVLVALAVLAVTGSVFLSVVSTSLRTTADVGRHVEAQALAQSLLARVGAEIPLREGQMDGQLRNGLRWRLRIETYGDAADRRAWPVGAYTIMAETFWNEGSRERSVLLTTLRLGPRLSTP